MTDREALERIAKGEVGHVGWCGEEGCDHAEDFAARYLAGDDPTQLRPRAPVTKRIVFDTAYGLSESLDCRPDLLDPQRPDTTRKPGDALP